jgi:putative transposase
MHTNQPQIKNKRREAQRLQAWDLNGKGWSIDNIAEAIGVTPPTIKRWLRRAAIGGTEALRTRKGQGNKSRLNAAQRQHLLKLLIHGAKQYGFVNDIWTSKRVCLVIQREFGVVYKPNYIGPFLNKLGWRLYGSGSEPARRKMRALQRWYPNIWDELDKTIGTTTAPAEEDLP